MRGFAVVRERGGGLSSPDVTAHGLTRAFNRTAAKGLETKGLTVVMLGVYGCNVRGAPECA